MRPWRLSVFRAEHASGSDPLAGRFGPGRHNSRAIKSFESRARTRRSSSIPAARPVVIDSWPCHWSHCAGIRSARACPFSGVCEKTASGTRTRKRTATMERSQRKGVHSGAQEPAAGRHTVLICQPTVLHFLLWTGHRYPTDKDVRLAPCRQRAKDSLLIILIADIAARRKEIASELLRIWWSLDSHVPIGVSSFVFIW